MPWQSRGGKVCQSQRGLDDPCTFRHNNRPRYWAWGATPNRLRDNSQTTCGRRSPGCLDRGRMQSRMAGPRGTPAGC
ncbi:hypothetical protein ATCV1_z146L [Acanthocystis turfacea chlorella virus 1]|uniref:Uncharacterized protein z146L n=1 Tax=Chlorovirus heliozoae TaxID=322019 RepID=A7K8A6_9PHYC|nr:hypothetical protein ATCV1_z146L [Acanthocystis turfacea chlorella virus 1]ABT16280.1 hypothetical protein ATCV1_z146L [Acanthocystis turfacea chlorella virus 1]